ncbi:MAG TPA: response regulator transcription factor [Caulobacteraceae bacterium]|jgi:FixJ family two-component response regulator
MPDKPPIVVIIDDDEGVRLGLMDLMESVGLGARTYPSVPDFLKDGLPDAPSCLVLDVRLPGQSGLELQQRLVSAGVEVPIIFITGHADVQMSVKAMKAGAVEFLAKPFREQDLLEAVHHAIEKSSERRRRIAKDQALTDRFAGLTSREREILAFVTSGRLNKQIAADLGVAEITVKVHRAQVMRKMGARSLADLVRMADQLGMTPKV